MARKKHWQLKKHGWKKGQSGNPKGAPPAWGTWEALYKKHLVTKSAYEIMKRPNLKKITGKEAMTIRDIQKAINGDSRAIDRIQDRTEGKAIERIIKEDHTMAKIREKSGGDPVKARKLLKQELEDRGIYINEELNIKQPDENK